MKSFRRSSGIFAVMAMALMCAFATAAPPPTTADHPVMHAHVKTAEVATPAPALVFELRAVQVNSATVGVVDPGESSCTVTAASYSTNTYTPAMHCTSAETAGSVRHAVLATVSAIERMDDLI